MGVVRTIVFPALRLLVWAVIAVALLWLAFGRGTPGRQEATASPRAVVIPPAATVTRGDVVNTVSLTGTITADPATTVKATATGTVARVRAEVGQAVEKGTPLFTVVVPVEDTSPPVAVDSTTPIVPGVAVLPVAVPPVAVPPVAKTKTLTVTATTAGILATLDVLTTQSVSVGDDVATISPGTLTVSAPLTQAQQFRLLAPPTTAQVTVPGGPGAFECTGLRTGTPTQTSQTPSENPGYYVDPYADPAQTPTGATVSCRVPDGVQVFAGLSANVVVTAGQAPGVLLAPVTAVQGTVGAGKV
ncbi:MAG: hypothetical protein ACRYF3_13030 [Janthinobacterium lividum]